VRSHRRAFAIAFALATAIFLTACRAYSASEPANQGAIFQHPDGRITANLTSRGWAANAQITDTSAILFYLYKGDKLTGIAFTNDPGFYGYDADSAFYFPPLEADSAQTYPDTKPTDPQSYRDADTWQCIKNPYSTNVNYGRYQCGVNASPIRFLNRSLTTHSLVAYAANSKGYPHWSASGFSQIGSAYASVKDGDKFSGFFAVYYNAMKNAVDAENRFDLASTLWKRPVEADLVSPRIDITVSLSAQGSRQAQGTTYNIPDYSTWYDAFASCRATQNVPAGSVYISEILWVGSKDTSGISSAEDEFIEIYNANSFDVNISGWRLAGAGAGSASVSIPICTTIKAQSVYVVAAGSAKAIQNANLVTSALALSNNGESSLNLTNASGQQISSLAGCTAPAWGSQGVNGTVGNAHRSMRLVSTTSPSTSCASGWIASSTADASYAASVQNLTTPYRAATDTGTNGTVATPGFKGP